MKCWLVGMKPAPRMKMYYVNHYVQLDPIDPLRAMLKDLHVPPRVPPRRARLGNEIGCPAERTVQHLLVQQRTRITGLDNGTPEWVLKQRKRARRGEVGGEAHQGCHVTEGRRGPGLRA